MKLERIQSVSTEKPGTPSAKPGGMKGAVQVISGDILVDDKPEQETPKQQYFPGYTNKKKIAATDLEETETSNIPEAQSTDSGLDITV